MDGWDTFAVNSFLWERLPPAVGHAMGRIDPQPAGWRAAGAEVSREGPQSMCCVFEVQLDLGWRTTDVRLSCWADEVRERRLSVDADGGWWQDDAPRADLAGCVDVDISATPLTNTFPLRRLGALSPGESTTLAVAWVDVPTLEVHRVDQTYTRLTGADRSGPGTWEYSDPLHGRFRLTVDNQGIVVDYEAFATRV